MKKNVDAFDYAGTICSAMKKGILLTTKINDSVNTMTIGWGNIGIEWNRPVFIAYVRKSRHTRKALDDSGEFTVNIPLEPADKNILTYCGRRSGRDTDKIRDLGFTLIESDIVKAPGIQEFPLTLECKVIYRQDQDLNAVTPECLDRFYPYDSETSTRDHHIAYYGEIVNAYLVEV